MATNSKGDGGFYADIDKGFQTYGIIPESKLKYQNAMVNSVSQDLLTEGKKAIRFKPNFIKTWSNTVGASENHINQCISKLDLGLPVAIGAWWPKKDKDKYKIVNGLALLDHSTNEKDYGDGKNNNGAMWDGHSVVLVGYKKHNTYPGGGFFIIRNSWGTGYGVNGYGFLSFEYVKNFANDLMIYEYDSPDKYNAVFVQKSEDEIQVYNWKYDDFKKKYDEIWKNGYRLHQLISKSNGTDILYSAIWHKGSYDEIQVYGWKLVDFYKKNEELSKNGMYLSDFDVIYHKGEILLSGFWVKGKNDQIVLLKPVSGQEMLEDFTQISKTVKSGAFGIPHTQIEMPWHSKGYYPSKIKMFKINTNVYYLAILKKEFTKYCFDKNFSDFTSINQKLYQSEMGLGSLENVNSLYSAVWIKRQVNEFQVFDWKYGDYRAKYNKIWNEGWRLKILSPSK